MDTKLKTHGKAKNRTPPTKRIVLEAMNGNCLRDNPIIYIQDTGCQNYYYL